MESSLIKSILLDIEGTTTPISFVHEVLFPYSRLHLTDFLKQNSNNPAVILDLQLLREERTEDERSGSLPALVEPYLHWLIDRDRKSPALKSLQGKIWKDGYNDGSLKSLVFDDVLPAFQRWRSDGKTINIFSSGSVLAQKLLFAHTNEGDLTPLISNYFDTAVGKKTAAESYRKIAEALKVELHEVHFVSDVTAELDAAADAGMKTSLCRRPGNSPQEDASRHPTILNFDQI